MQNKSVLMAEAFKGCFSFQLKIKVWLRWFRGIGI